MRHYILIAICFGAASLAHAENPLRRIGHGMAEMGRGVRDTAVVTGGAVGSGTKKTAGAVKNGVTKSAETTEEGLKRVGRGSQSVGKGFKDGTKEVVNGRK